MSSANGSMRPRLRPMLRPKRGRRTGSAPVLDPPMISMIMMVARLPICSSIYRCRWKTRLEERARRRYQHPINLPSPPRELAGQVKAQGKTKEMGAVSGRSVHCFISHFVYCVYINGPHVSSPETATRGRVSSEARNSAFLYRYRAAFSASRLHKPSTPLKG